MPPHVSKVNKTGKKACRVKNRQVCRCCGSGLCLQLLVSSSVVSRNSQASLWCRQTAYHFLLLQQNRQQNFILASLMPAKHSVNGRTVKLPAVSKRRKPITDGARVLEEYQQRKISYDAQQELERPFDAQFLQLFNEGDPDEEEVDFLVSKVHCAFKVIIVIIVNLQGANIDASDAFGKTALMTAAKSGCIEGVKVT